MNIKTTVLIAPLDWGLGHATRCIPIIREFLKRDCKVLIASSGGALQLLKIEFPELVFFEIASYKVEYATDNKLLAKLFFQSYKFLGAIRKEHDQLQLILRSNKVDLIISDNRFGCYSKDVRSVFVTHQLNFLFQPPLKWVSKLFSSWNQRRIKKFDACWVPDFSSQQYSGKLSSANGLPISFIGVLSRFQKLRRSIEKQYDVLALISGPEPQRTIFEELIRHQLTTLSLKVLIVKGKPEEGMAIIDKESLQEVGHLKGEELQYLIEASEYVICRSGYSSIMDLAVLQKNNVIMVPTPGQPEQEYLADYLESKGLVYTVSQEKFTLSKALKKSIGYLGLSSSTFNNELLSESIDEVLLNLKMK